VTVQGADVVYEIEYEAQRSSMSGCTGTAWSPLLLEFGCIPHRFRQEGKNLERNVPTSRRLSPPPRLLQTEPRLRPYLDRAPSNEISVSLTFVQVVLNSLTKFSFALDMVAIDRSRRSTTGRRVSRLGLIQISCLQVTSRTCSMTSGGASG
jgi:hypothetical protein